MLMRSSKNTWSVVLGQPLMFIVTFFFFNAGFSKILKILDLDYKVPVMPKQEVLFA